MSSATRARNFRRRGDVAEEDDNGKDNSNNPTATQNSSSSKPSAKKPPKLLNYTVKDRKNPSSSLPSNVQPQAGTYTKEALLELQKNTRTLAAPSSRATSVASDPKIVGMMAIGKEVDLDSSAFPDQATIDAIKAKKDRARKSFGRPPDYISLDGGSNHGERAMGVVSGKDEIHDEDNDDEEEKLWEEEQFRKGLGKRLDDSSNRVVISSSTTAGVAMVHNMPQQHQKTFGYSTMASYGSVALSVSQAPPSSIDGAAGASQALDVPSISQQAEIAKKALQENVIRLKESHARTISSLTKADENLSASLFNITALEKTADNDDEVVEVEAAVKAAMLVFSERGSSAAMIEVATNAAQAASAAIREQANLSVKLDEFGRDVNRQKRLDIERRAEARHHRKARFDSKRLSSMDSDSSYQKIEGESSTDESDSESTAYQSNRDQLLQTADQVFSDASEEYSQLSAVKQKFEKLKKDYSSSYRDAYMSLSIPAIFSPYVRLELLKWDPLHRDEDFSDMKWHNLLFNYGFPEDGNFASDDADANLVPALVEKIALPVLHHEISHCWDMLSSQETKNAVSATSLIIDYVPASSEALAELLVTIRTRLREAVTDIMVPTWSPLVMKAVPNAARVAAYRFGMSVRLMRNICLWKDILALPVLEKLALDELLCGKILPHIRCIASDVHDAVTRTERIVASLSGLWTGTNVSRDSSVKLQPLVDCVLSLGKALERRHASGVSEGEAGGLARRLKKILVELNEYDNARDIARRFHLKEAL
ncbi:RAB geranylgeranyl transferase beta subunit 1 [Hibiscus syriacus]|uniref:RAB geranylgeranyl transferase beta subunit 1 n=1 Tax=Hibiscus syriacus TaxID=106335 RepID=A0A6A3C679_HIBSY|nr:RAB geranylgeranyl transferase beta subunit 1 [Hibiscus syriacus]